MKRKAFLKSVAGCGLCSCLGTGVVLAKANEARDDGFSASKDCEWEKNFTQKRFNWLLQLMEEELDTTEYNKIIRRLGVKCAESIENIAIENKGNPEGYFNKVNSMWGEVFTYDREKQIVSLNTNLQKCPCPNVNMNITPESYCDCSLGWQKHMFEIVFGKPVEVRHIETILRGGRTCRFEIRIKS